MSEKKATEERFTTAGWLFLCITLAILVGPSIYLARKITYEETPWIGVVGTGVILAAVTAGLITWAANSALQYRAARRRLAAKKKGKRK